MRVLLVIVHTLACLLLIAAVLMQAGRGGGVGAAFAGASGQIFGGRGASSFLVRFTSCVAAVFFLTSLSLSMVSSRHRSVLEGLPAGEGAAHAPATGDAQEGGGDAAAPADVAPADVAPTQAPPPAAP